MSVSVVLVNPVHIGNVGSAARAMKNMGLERLLVVNPAAPLLSMECLKMAGNAVDVVQKATVFATFDEAVADHHVIVGSTSARDRMVRQRLYTPREIAGLVQEYSETEKIALVFGSENAGLTDAELSKCQYVVCILSAQEYPVLNLAQAVLIVAYEIFIQDKTGWGERWELATHQEREQMFAHLEKTLINIGFLSARNPEPILHSIKRFLGRADLTPRDIQILRGILSQMEWYAQEGHRLAPVQIRKP